MTAANLGTDDAQAAAQFRVINEVLADHDEFG
jgi:hypothetical protein